MDAPPLRPRLRAVLTNLELEKLRSKTRKNGRVAVRPSGFAGLGVFTLTPFKTGEIVCYFRGVAVRTEDVDALPDDDRRVVGRYMMCAEDGQCCVPLRADHNKPPSNLPAELSGVFINEACSRPEGEYDANVYVYPSSTTPSLTPCHWFRAPVFDWEVKAYRDLKPGEELLICYGPSYGARFGYKEAKSCSCCCE